MARHGWPFMGELGLVVDAVQGWGWGVGELAIGAEPVQVRRSAVANEERVRRCCPLTLAGVASRSRSGRGVARVHARGGVCCGAWVTSSRCRGERWCVEQSVASRRCLLCFLHRAIPDGSAWRRVADGEHASELCSAWVTSTRGRGKREGCRARRGVASASRPCSPWGRPVRQCATGGIGVAHATLHLRVNELVSFAIIHVCEVGGRSGSYGSD